MMSQVDEGLIHAWLDGQLPADEAARIERLVATDAAWSAAAAAARGVVAGASRILGALDEVPSVRQVAAPGTAARARRSVWRAPWLRAAAGIALVAGVGSLLIREWPANQSLNETGAKDVSGATIRSAPAEVSAPPSPLAGLKVSPVDSHAVAPSSGVRQSVKRDPAPLKDGLRVDAAKTTAPTSSIAGGSAAPAGAGAAVAQTAALDSARVNALALQKPVAAAASADAGRAGAGGGRGGGVALGGRALNAAATAREQPSAKSFADAQIIDPRLSGCWLVADSVPSRAYVLRFVDPVATDVLRAPAAPLVERGAVAPAAMPREMSRAPAGVRVQQATPRTISVDSFSAEWLTRDERTTLTFTVRADTLTGSARRTAGDIAYPVSAVRAARVQCPP